MEVVLWIVGFTIVSSLFFVYVMLFGQSEFHRDGLIGKIQRFMVYTVPTTAGRIAVKVCGRKMVNLAGRLGDYVFNQANPLLQLFYLFLVTSSCIVFYSLAYGRILEGVLTSHLHAVTAPLLTATTYYFFYAACKSDPGMITQGMIREALKVYPCDGVLFVEGKTCSSCNFEKPARSKHCSICKACIARFDHRETTTSIH